jgi:DNA repair exonuclease SbcCD ATPase subunit
MEKKIDHLTEDKPISGQLFVCISFLSPEGIRNCKVRGLKIRGVYGTKEEADERAKELQQQDPDFHVFVGEVGKWLPWDPDPNSVTDQVYKEEELQKLMQSYKKNREHIRELENERKEELKSNSKVDSRKEETVNRLRKKLDKMKEKHEEIRQTNKSNDTNPTVANDESVQNSDLNDELKKIDSLYKKLQDS